ncbi:MAG: hypothetical protein K1X88_05500 [Nannocystaceae bacterium]|nr:hypothetical protein [Nannocystaceae bacterium]
MATLVHRLGSAALRHGVALLAVACGPQVDGGGDASTGDLGERPEAMGAMYSACSQVEECAPLGYCVYPTREGGFCSARCAAPGDASTCDEAPGEGAEVSCLDIGLPEGDEVCALDCSAGGCPQGMRCEAIATPAGQERRICF